MSVKFNHLKLNKDKTQFIWLGVPLQLSKVQCQKITMGGTDIQIFTEAICLGVLLDRRLSGRCFYHLRRSQKMQRRRWCMLCYKLNWLLQQCYLRFKCGSQSTPAKCTQCSCSTCVAQAEVWPCHCWRSGSFTLASTSAAGGVRWRWRSIADSRW